MSGRTVEKREVVVPIQALRKLLGLEKDDEHRLEAYIHTEWQRLQQLRSSSKEQITLSWSYTSGLYCHIGFPSNKQKLVSTTSSVITLCLSATGIDIVDFSNAVRYVFWVGKQMQAINAQEASDLRAAVFIAYENWLKTEPASDSIRQQRNRAHSIPKSVKTRFAPNEAADETRLPPIQHTSVKRPVRTTLKQKQLEAPPRYAPPLAIPPSPIPQWEKDLKYLTLPVGGTVAMYFLLLLFFGADWAEQVAKNGDTPLQLCYPLPFAIAISLLIGYMKKRRNQMYD